MPNVIHARYVPFLNYVENFTPVVSPVKRVSSHIKYGANLKLYVIFGMAVRSVFKQGIRRLCLDCNPLR